MPDIFNLDELPDKHIDDPDFKSGLKTKYLGVLAGSKQIYVNIDYVKPGAKSVKYHSHSLQEEFLLFQLPNWHIVPEVFSYCELYCPV